LRPLSASRADETSKDESTRTFSLFFLLAAVARAAAGDACCARPERVRPNRGGIEREEAWIENLQAETEGLVLASLAAETNVVCRVERRERPH
jgi:hypothetical protein